MANENNPGQDHGFPINDIRRKEIAMANPVTLGIIMTR
jgi:hypothetical protein